jgi:hypothetical protein
MQAVRDTYLGWRQQAVQVIQGRQWHQLQRGRGLHYAQMNAALLSAACGAALLPAVRVEDLWVACRA